MKIEAKFGLTFTAYYKTPTANEDILSAGIEKVVSDFLDDFEMNITSCRGIADSHSVLFKVEIVDLRKFCEFANEIGLLGIKIY